MLSQYTWGQFFVFTLVVLVLYYLVVGLMYYRDDFSAFLKGKKPAGALAGAGAGVGTSAVAPPSLVRAKSAFVTSPTATESAPATVAAPEDGAADNLAEASAAVVGGELPSSTATATGRDDSTDDGGPMDAASSVAGATDEAVAMDADREEQDDRPNEALAAIIRQKAHEMQPDQTASGSDEGQEDNLPNPTAKINTEGVNIETKRTLVDVNSVEPEIVYQPAIADSYEPLADFNMPVASTLDVAPVLEEELFEVDSVADYISQVQAGEKPAAPAALAGTSLAEQLAQFTTSNTDELADLFGNDSE
ncbi:hypothetical protein E4631_23175 [Hymenobacter sp. UV11]|uniref:hypothetical protein n=1 Tax=Hymenobacter sp. UV11 TaxID=1849735 RepID=UPI0010764307|nr:hypothetical protein [Hymenobacter sp. UV11]TDN39866.1 hypothetical protein A8B98_16885 [Hymenobacter sp. UV11]TFZ63210.1 hypothetical protein E4631_23175 [Hymenobacter sp. UV11]